MTTLHRWLCLLALPVVLVGLALGWLLELAGERRRLPPWRATRGG